MILFDNVVEILDLADFDRGTVLGIVALDRRFVGCTAINRDLLGDTVTPNRLFQKAQCRFLVPLFSEEEINGPARLIYGAIEVIPVKRLLELGAIFDDPSVNRGVI